MTVLTIRTDNPIAEIGLYKDQKRLAYESWEGHRQLSATIHGRIEKLLEGNKLDWQDIQGLVFYAGPGSFTGLRIGAAVANGLASGLDIPIVSTKGGGWAESGLKKLQAGKDEKTARIFYGRQPRITKPRK